MQQPRRDKATLVPGSAFPFQKLPRLSRLFENGIKRVVAGLAPARSFTGPAPAANRAEIVPAIPKSLLKAEVGALPAQQCLVASGQFTVHWARAGQFPWCLQEIGRLRELTFRVAGEGSGKSSDIDLFDAYYLHIFVWDSQAEAIVGAYRLGRIDEILARFGKRGLYTYSLFQYKNRVLQAMGPAIELGRSFVRTEYQRTFAPLIGST